MKIEELLRKNQGAIVEEALQATIQLDHYRRDPAATRRRVEELLVQLTAAVSARDVSQLLAYVRGIARERAGAGFGLEEVQAAFSALEEAIWHRALMQLPAYDLPWAHGMVSTALAHGRDALRRAFGSRTIRVPAPFPDLTPLFRGTESKLAPCPEEEFGLAV